MAKDININGADWCDMVFEGKNKGYGAYVMRSTTSKRHVTAMFVTLALILFVIFLPSLIETVKKLTQSRVVMDEKIVMADLAPLDERVKEENIKPTVEQVPTPPLRSTVKFTAPVITDEPIEEGEELKSQDELSSSKTTISVANVMGDDEDHGVDIADLADHQIPQQIEILDYAEQNPEFPGGDEELMKFLQKNLRYPNQALEMGLEGSVLIRFVVNGNGSVSNVEVSRGFDPSCDKEALRVVRMMPKWIPGRMSGKAVPVYFKLPITFKIKR